MVDDPFQIPSNYPEYFSWKGMNLIDYMIVPHYHSEHPESSKINDLIVYLKENNLPYKTLHDGEVVGTEGKRISDLQRRLDILNI